MIQKVFIPKAATKNEEWWHVAFSLQFPNVSDQTISDVGLINGRTGKITGTIVDPEADTCFPYAGDINDFRTEYAKEGDIRVWGEDNFTERAEKKLVRTSSGGICY